MSAPDIVAPLYEHAAKGIRKFPCHVNRASALGGDCERQLVYMRTHWQDRQMHDVHLELIFREGNLHEEAVLRALGEAGVTVIEQQTTLEWREYRITGHVDGVVVQDGRAVPLEIKSMSDHIWSSIAKRGPGVYEWSEVSGAFQAKPWLRKYLGQLSIYMLCKDVDRGILLLKNKSTGAMAQVNVELDYEYAESLIQRAERINRHIDQGTLPDRIAWRPDVCGRCPWLHLCLPDRVGHDPIEFLEDETIVELIEERERLSDDRAAYEAVDKQLKAWAKARPERRIEIGGWLVEKTALKRGVRVDIRPVAPHEDTVTGEEPF